MKIDHVIYGTCDLDQAAAKILGELGLQAVPGGRHEGLGTHNRIVSLGDGSFIELLAVADPAEAQRSELGAAFAAAIARGDGLLGWAVAVEDLDVVAARLRTPVTTVGRQGRIARLTGVAESIVAPFLPFFIERRGKRDARATEATTGEITQIEVAGDPRRLNQWLGGESLPVRVVAGQPSVRAIVVEGRELRSGY